MLVYSQEVKEQKREKRGIYSPLYFSLFFFFSIFLFRSSALDFSVLLSYSPPFIVNQLSESLVLVTSALHNMFQKSLGCKTI